jgi:hypothetical protein
MKKLLCSTILACAVLLQASGGCATAPQNAAQAVYAAHGTYTVALTAAVKYKQLPPCGTPTSPGAVLQAGSGSPAAEGGRRRVHRPAGGPAHNPK